ncbi:hypothetical protein PVA45_07705 (plasmid) [Entomospira entomophila]|uniref:Uncharacterized protein n=1 Tax=Entomospira entomophila TaxID=2719988 RepID=A0A968GA33_9SPIO|nr:hypothetical protein [Entomospira entomophilus]NIZ41388.1 hypothetical protein [Entomospira entomophilus]WDI36338.1 hypothetical protein PVA45_07705 [Entomospira entomophilus]
MRPLTQREAVITRSILIIGITALVIISYLLIAPPLRLRSLQKRHFSDHQLTILQEAIPAGVSSSASEAIFSFFQLNEWNNGSEVIHFDAHNWGLMVAPKLSHPYILDAEGEAHPLFDLLDAISDKIGDEDLHNQGIAEIEALRLDTLHFDLIVMPAYFTQLRSQDGHLITIDEVPYSGIRLEQITFYQEGFRLDGYSDQPESDEIAREAKVIAFYYHEGHLIKTDDLSRLGAEIASIPLGQAFIPKLWLKGIESIPSLSTELIEYGRSLQKSNQSTTNIVLTALYGNTKMQKHATRMASTFSRLFQHQLRRSGFMILDEFQLPIIMDITHIAVKDNGESLLLKTHHGLYRFHPATKAVALIHPEDPLQSQRQKWIKL